MFLFLNPSLRSLGGEFESVGREFRIVGKELRGGEKTWAGLNNPYWLQVRSTGLKDTSLKKA